MKKYSQNHQINEMVVAYIMAGYTYCIETNSITTPFLDTKISVDKAFSDWRRASREANRLYHTNVNFSLNSANI